MIAITTSELIEVPEDALLDVFITHEPVWDFDFSSDRPKECLGCSWTAQVTADDGMRDNEVQWEQHLVEAVKQSATAAEHERLERHFRDSRR